MRQEENQDDSPHCATGSKSDDDRDDNTCMNPPRVAGCFLQRHGQELGDLDHSATSRQSRMEKDPLNIGVPMPVIVSSETAKTTLEISKAETKAKREMSPEDLKCSRGPVAAVKGSPEKANRINEDQGAFLHAECHDMSEAATVSVVAPRDCLAADESTLNEPSESSNAPAPATLQSQRTLRPITRPGSFAIPGPLADSHTQSLLAEDYSGEVSIDVEQPLEGAHVRTSDASRPHQMVEGGGDLLVEATLVASESSESEDKPDVVLAKPVSSFFMTPKAGLMVLLIFAAIIIGLAVGMVKTKESSSSTSAMGKLGGTKDSTTALEQSVWIPTLDKVRQRGVLSCGFTDVMNKFIASMMDAQRQSNQTGNQLIQLKNDFAQRLCQSIAAALLGPENASIEMVPYVESEKIQILQNRSADIVFSRTPISMKQDVFESKANEGLTFSMPFLYAGASFTGLPEYVQCADDDINIFGNCSDMKVCMNEEVYFAYELKKKLPQNKMVLFNASGKVFPAFMAGQCNVIALESPRMAFVILRAMGYQGNLAMGKRLYTPDMYSLTSLDQDPAFGDFVNAVLMALLAAEEAGITQATAEAMGTTDLFGEEHKEMFVNALHPHGNFGELYNYGVPRNGRNLVNDGSTGLLASPLLGQVEYPDPNLRPHPGGIIELVQQRGSLQCGIHGGRPGFAYLKEGSEWKGIDVDYCRALAASLFEGDASSVKFHDIGNRNNSESSSGFALLHSGEIDVYAGAIWTLESDMKEPVTGVGYSFSQPYFYGPMETSEFEENLALATAQEDAQWTSLVYWVAQSIVYAEEQGIVQEESSQLPLVFVFGLELQRIFRDSVLSVGNYQEVYDRNLQAILPRAGRNQLNRLEDNAPMRYVPPGFHLSRNSSRW